MRNLNVRFSKDEGLVGRYSLKRTDRAPPPLPRFLEIDLRVQRPQEKRRSMCYIIAMVM